MVKLKVIGTISAFLLFIGLMMWGLFAWSGNDNQKEENLNKINGSINFEVDDVYASVYGEITGSKEAIGSQDGKVFLNTLRFGESQNPDTTTWTSILANGNSNPATKITFTENGSIVTITVKIENLATDRPMLISITDTATAVKNVSRVMKLGEEVYTGDLLLIPAKQDGSTAHIVEVDLTMDVLNAKASIDDDAFYKYLRQILKHRKV